MSLTGIVAGEIIEKVGTKLLSKMLQAGAHKKVLPGMKKATSLFLDTMGSAANKFSSSEHHGNQSQQKKMKLADLKLDGKQLQEIINLREIALENGRGEIEIAIEGQVFLMDTNSLNLMPSVD